ncbi:antibiotic biosynthesis monooxygenase [Roseococcus sp. SDR]|uniref:putative quinol monooxygenase n=1 Tax=Roseococcus sp. SDR TaxID=2835532 RepID=UPI001BCE5053|nr:antibiotic biosynthesis monooxygenase [Roseococcus sp. SDR]MBS7788554.1 antibiotic biosynthesis monooxygenase [Roseococcus sp. SDR]MBV1843868.1 antibiotic biosynthesis monooxygenase [Roseococcus sp. SDR]
MSSIALIVEFEVRPGCHAALLAVMRRHAAACLADEPGLERFDVLEVMDAEGRPDPSRLMLYEVFRDQAAREDHWARPRHEATKAEFAPLIHGRSSRLLRLGPD